MRKISVLKIYSIFKFNFFIFSLKMSDRLEPIEIFSQAQSLIVYQMICFECFSHYFTRGDLPFHHHHLKRAKKQQENHKNILPLYYVLHMKSKFRHFTLTQSSFSNKLICQRFFMCVYVIFLSNI